MDTEKIKSIISDIRVIFDILPVAGKTGKEALLSVKLNQFDDEMVTAKHFYGDTMPKTEKEIVQTMYVNMLKYMADGSERLLVLQGSFWQRLKFVFTR